MIFWILCQIRNRSEKGKSNKVSQLYFIRVGNTVGTVLEYYTDSTITCTVVDDRKVEYNGEIMSLTGVAKIITGKTSGIAGPRCFKYKGAWLWDIEGQKEM